ncbi:MAG: hypothetical protein ACLVL7_13270 [Anaerotruncus massiliensis (ex Togo et al. 2019)]
MKRFETVFPAAAAAIPPSAHRAELEDYSGAAGWVDVCRRGGDGGMMRDPSRRSEISSTARASPTSARSTARASPR